MSQITSVFKHEWKYFLTLKNLRSSILVLILAPAIFLLLSNYFLDDLNLYYPVLIMALAVPRIPVNLVAYSIAGEKVYKTFESLLSTPVRTRPMFIGKSIVSILLSAVMLIFSALLSLLTANLVGHFILHDSEMIWFSFTQMLLIFAVGLMVCVLMIFITGMLAMTMQKPRHGLYIAYILSFLSLIPPLAIVYVAENTLLWTVIYFVLLLCVNMFFSYFVLEKIKRTQIMRKI